MSNSLNLQEIDQEQALHLCRFFMRANQNILLVGRRGVGKTHIAIQAAADCGFKINYVNLSVIERPDLAGFPDLHSPGDIVTYKSPAFLPTLKEGEKADSILLFDEVDKAPPEVTSPLLEILQNKKINGKPLNAAGCILTGNLLNEGAYSNVISSAILDRVSKYILSFSFEKWFEWAVANDVHELIRGFLSSNPDMCCGDVETTYFATPSPRGWTLASDALYKAKAFKLTDIDTITSIVSGFVGNEAGIRFKSWYEYYRKFEPFILSYLETGNFVQSSFNAEDPNEKLVFSITLTYLAKMRIDNKSKNRILDHLCNFFETQDITPEIEALAIQNAFPMEFVTKNKLYSHPKFFGRLSTLSILK